MSALHQLLHEEEFRWGEQPYRLFVYRGDGGIMGRWRCGACQSDYDHEDCFKFSSVGGCLDSMKRAISEHYQAAGASADPCPRCQA